MNRIYRLVFNRALGQFQVASEVTARQGARTPARPRRMAARLRAAPLLLACMGGASVAATLPTGFAVNSGTATINMPNADLLQVTQASNKALITWNSFDIGAGGTVSFDVPSTSAVTLNVVTGGVFSSIAGSLSGNGQVFLVNPSGMLFSSGSSVNVGGLVASTLPLASNIADDTYQFSGNANSSAGIVNQGTLTASGSITLLGANVTNTGFVHADTINLVSASRATLAPETSPSGNLVYAAAVQGTVDVSPGAAAIGNTGVLDAGSLLALKANLATGVASTAINLDGVANANGVAGSPGNLVLQASGSGIVQSGNVSATHASVTTSGAYSQTGGFLHTDQLSLDTTGNTTLNAAGNAVSTIDGSVAGNLSLTNGTSLAQSSALVVGGALTLDNGANAITLSDAGNAFGSAVTLASGAAAISASGALHLGSVDATSLSVDAASILLGDDITTTGAQSYGGPVSLLSDVTLASTSGGNIAFHDSIDGAHALAVNTAGVTGFDSAIGATVGLASLSTDATGSTRLGGSVMTSGNVSFGDDLTLLGNASVHSTGGDVGFDGRVDGASSLTVWSAGSTTFSRALGSLNPLASLTASAGSGVFLGGNVTTSGAIGFATAVNLTNDASVASQGGNVTFGGTVDGNRLLGVSTPGSARFDGAVGAITRVGGLTVDAGQFSSQGIAVTGPLSLDIDATITQGGAYEAFGTATFRSANDIVLTNAGNNFLGPVGLWGGNAFLTGSALQVDGVDVDALTISANSLLLQNASVNGSAVLTSHAGVGLGGLAVGGDLSINAGTGGISGGPVQVGGHTTLVGAQNVVLDQPGNSFGGLVDLTAVTGSVSSTGTLRMGNIAVTDLSLHGGRIELAGDVTTSGSQSYYGALALQRDTTFSGSALNFVGSIDGAYALTANASGDTTFDGAFGTQSALASLRTNVGGRTWLSGAIQASGDVIFGDAVLLADDTRVTSTGGSIQFGNSVGAPHALVLQAADAVTLDGAVGASLALQSLQIRADSLQSGSMTVSDALSIDVRDSLTLGGISAASVHAGTAGDLVLDDTIRAGTVELAAGGQFRNLAGSQALITPATGYWHIYLSNPNTAHVYGGLDSGNRAVWNAPAFAATAAAGNRYLFDYQPTLTFASLDASKTYGEVIDLGGAWVARGAMTGVAGAWVGDTLADVFSGSPLVSSAGAAATAGVAGSPYTVQISNGTLDVGDSGYALAFDNAGRLSVTPAALTIVAGNASKTQGEATVLTGYTVEGLVNGDNVDLVNLSSTGAGAAAAAGRYAIEATGAQGSALGNYTIRYVAGVLTVLASPLSPVDPVDPIIVPAASAQLARAINALRPFQPMPLQVASRPAAPELTAREGGLHLPAQCEPHEGEGCITLRLP